MRILLINNFNYIRGGSDRVFFETAKLLRDNGHIVGLFTADEIDNNSLELSNVQSFTTLDFLSNSTISTLKKSFLFIKNGQAQNDLENVLTQFNPDVVHLHIFQSRLSSFILKTIYQKNIPMLMTVHEYKMRCPTYLHLDNDGNICEKCSHLNYTPCIINRCVEGSFSKSLLMALESYSRDLLVPYVTYIDKFIMVSEFIRKKHLERFPKHTDKFIQIYNFIDEQKFDADYSYGNYILYYGRLSKEKGLYTLLYAAQKQIEIPFVIVGDGILKEELEQFVIDNNMINVRFIPFQKDGSLSSLIQNARFTILPSECYESMGLTVIESFFCKTPVIGAAIGGIKELVKSNENGFLFESRNIDELSKVIEKAWNTSPQEHQILAGNGYKFAQKKFNKALYYQKLLEVYKDIIK